MKESVITTSAKDTRTKHELATALKEIQPKLKAVDLALSNEIVYLLNAFAKDQTKVLKSALIEVLDRANSVDLTPLVEKKTKKTKQPVEASAKKQEKPVESLRKPVAKTAPKEVEEEAEEAEAKPVKKMAKPKAEKKPEVVKAEVKTAPPATSVGADFMPRATMFPAEIDHPELGKLVAVPGKYHKYPELLSDLLDNKTVYFASYWTKRQLKEYAYAAWKNVDPKVVAKGFPNDLDILMAVVPCETMERVFAMSRITEAMFQFEGEDFTPLEDKDGDKTYLVRVSAGMEFEVYVPADEVTPEVAPEVTKKK